ncbi:MAG TPA: hypothetical protein VFY13_01170 [Luteolibacter sp.]|nr:hypothetical protein [Luteolibacter sp.]
MYRPLLLISLLIAIASILVRWWFGMRFLQEQGTRSCRCDLEAWLPAAGDPAKERSETATAWDFGDQLRRKALAQWSKDDPNSYRAREGSRRFGLAVPPLSLLVALFAMVVGKIPLVGAAAIFCVATAIACALGLMSLPAELAAVSRHAAKTRKARCFPNRDDEDAVIECALAHCWNRSLPPVLNWVEKRR